LIDEYKGHPSIARLFADGYQTITLWKKWLRSSHKFFFWKYKKGSIQFERLLCLL